MSNGSSVDCGNTFSNQNPEPIQVRLITKNLGEVAVRPVDWLVPNFIPMGMFTLLSGHGGTGKSSVLAHLVACVTRGEPAFGLDYSPESAGDVLIYNCEDAVAEVLVPRLHAAGANVNRVRQIQGVNYGNGKQSSFSLQDIQALEEVYRSFPFKLLIIDPISSTVGNAGKNDNSETDIRPLLEGLSQFAEAHRVAAIGVKHLKKGESESAAMRVQRSIAYTSVARTVLTLTIHPEHNELRILARAKCNLPVRGDKGVSFESRPPEDPIGLVRRIAPNLTEDEAEKLADQLYHCTNFSPWNGDIDELTTGRASQREPRRNSDALKSCAAQWLEGFLKNGPKHSILCVSEGNRELETKYGGDWWKKNILESILGGKSFRLGNHWSWRLRPDKDESTEEDLVNEPKEDSELTLASDPPSHVLDAIKG